MSHRLLLLLIVPLLLGADFKTPKTDGKYRVWIGPDEQVDWIDVCCRYNEQLQLEFADYTPIEAMEVSYQQGLPTYRFRKKYSTWKLSNMMGGRPEGWVLEETSRLLP